MPLNCWEFMLCGREPNGAREAELGRCPAATEAFCEGVSCEGVNRGRMCGRICWIVAGTLCGGEVQGSSAKKRDTCLGCKFLRQVELEEGDHFHLICPGS